MLIPWKTSHIHLRVYDTFRLLENTTDPYPK